MRRLGAFIEGGLTLSFSIPVELVVDAATIQRGAELFDQLPHRVHVSRFLADSNHHLLFAWDEAGRAVGFVSAMELRHPDRDTEMYVDELGVEESARRRGVATALIAALRAVARDAGCCSMWAATEPDNAAAAATYRRAGATAGDPAVIFTWPT